MALRIGAQILSWTLAWGAVAPAMVCAQNVLPAPVAPVLRSAQGEQDRALVMKIDDSRRELEASLKDYLVAVDTRPDLSSKKVGLTLTNFSGSPLAVAYDPSGKSMMAQWRSEVKTSSGQVFQYQAFVGEAGAVNFVISSRF
jgi:hypothetical protein